MSSATDVLKKFMSSLDETTKTGEAALDEAVQACSEFSGIEELISSFVTDSRFATNSSTFLQSSCDIQLYNADTGAISGSDAGGAVVKDADSVVPESGTAVLPEGAASIIDGLTVIWPTGTLSTAEQILVKGLNSWWLPAALELINESYGLSFTKEDVLGNTLKVKFSNNNNSILASMGYNTSGELGLTLTINEYYYGAIQEGDENGTTDRAGMSQALDRTLAHEFVHALMMANISSFSSLPQFITEGTADLVQGIDDKWSSLISTLAANPYSLKSALDLTDTGTGSSNSYVAGYMLLRYMAAQADTGAKICYADNDTRLIIGKGCTSDVIWLGDPAATKAYSTSVRTIDASAATRSLALIGNGKTAVKIIGGSGANAMWGGSSAADTMEGGTGKDTFWYAAGDGNDTVTSFDSSKDTLKFYQGGFDSYKTSGSDLVLTAGSGQLTVKNGAARRIAIESSGITFDCWFAHTTGADSVAFSSDINLYVGSAAATDTLLVTGSKASIINLQSQQDIWYLDMDIVDASAASGSQVLIGSAAAATKLIGGSGTNAMWGGSGAADILQGGSGTDTFWYGTGDGQDTITKSSAGDVLYIYSADFACTSFAMQGSSLVIAGQAGDSLTVKDWTATTGANILRISDNSEYQLYQAKDGSIGAQAR